MEETYCQQYPVNTNTENTNFKYEICGPVTDILMIQVNSLFNLKNKNNRITKKQEEKKEVAAGDRIRMLKEAGCNLTYISPCAETAKRNLVLSGGTELHQIVGEALKYYYWEGEIKNEYAPISKAMNYVIKTNPAEYNFNDIESIYNKKISDLLYNMYMGMNLGSSWNGRSCVNGGYIVMKPDSDVIVYRSCIADEFKDFLLNKLGFEYPSTSRHKHMQIYKENDKYYIKFNLQLRFMQNKSEN